MRQETIVRTIAKYDELTQDQRDKAIDNLNLSDDFEFQAESTLEYFETALNILGFNNVKFQYSGFWSQGDGASFTGTFNVPKAVKELKDRMSKLKEEFPTFNIHDYGSLRFTKEEKEEDTLNIFRISSFYSHSGTVSSDNEALRELVRDISNDLYKALEKDYDYVTSREYKEDVIAANGWEFYTDTLKLA